MCMLVNEAAYIESIKPEDQSKREEITQEWCHAQLLAVTICVIWLVGLSVEVVLPSLVQ